VFLVLCCCWASLFLLLLFFLSVVISSLFGLCALWFYLVLLTMHILYFLYNLVPYNKFICLSKKKSPKQNDRFSINTTNPCGIL
jgi:uncharacterized protein (DUF58 family)